MISHNQHANEDCQDGVRILAIFLEKTFSGIEIAHHPTAKTANLVESLRGAADEAVAGPFGRSSGFFRDPVEFQDPSRS